VLDGEAADDDVVFDLVFAVDGEGDEVVGGGLAFKVDEAGHHAADVVGDAFVADDGSLAHALEPPLGAVVSEGADVVHVPVREGDELAREHGARTDAHVEAEVELGDMDARGFARDAGALDAVLVEEQEAECRFTSRGLGEHSWNPSTSAPGSRPGEGMKKTGVRTPAHAAKIIADRRASGCGPHERTITHGSPAERDRDPA